MYIAIIYRPWIEQRLNDTVWVDLFISLQFYTSVVNFYLSFRIELEKNYVTLFLFQYWVIKLGQLTITIYPLMLMIINKSYKIIVKRNFTDAGSTFICAEQSYRSFACNSISAPILNKERYRNGSDWQNLPLYKWLHNDRRTCECVQREQNIVRDYYCNRRFVFTSSSLTLSSGCQVFNDNAIIKKSIHVHVRSRLLQGLGRTL